MNKRKHYGRKIKKTKNLYRRKKTAGQKVFSTVMLVIAVSAAAFVGFCVGKPLLEYLGNMQKTDLTEMTPRTVYEEQKGIEADQPGSASTDSDISGVSETERAEAVTAGENEEFRTTPSKEEQAPAESSGNSLPTEDTSATTVPVMAGNGSLSAFEAPAGALSNRSSLSAVLAKARSGGYNSAVIQLKDKSGYFHYKTEIEGTEDLIKGTMSLDEIMTVFKENSIIPIAEIAVLSDNMGCEAFPEMSFKIANEPSVSWLDYSSEGHPRWSNPENSATREYFAKISAELNSAGFENIMLTDVVFPDFQHYDFERSYIDYKYGSDDRYKMLYNVVKAGNIIEIRAADVLSDPLGRTAEILRDTSMLHDNKIAVIISRNDFTTEAGFPADAKSMAETVLSFVKQKTGDLTVIPIIESSGFDDAEKAKIISSFGSMGYDSYIIR